MKPYVICHMLSSIDGKIDGPALKDVTGDGEYETTGDQLGGDAWICGRVTMQKHFADEAPFVSSVRERTGPHPVHVARQANSYAISVDPHGKLQWSSNEIDGDHLICVISEDAPRDYPEMLREKNISYIVSGSTAINFDETLNLLSVHFGIRTLLLEGGGHINGALLQAGLVDEVSLLIVPAIDGRHEIPTTFDGMTLIGDRAVPLKLKSVDRRERDALWVRYEVIRP
jgi:2,5-diamino-6-(ribosylamino)-4(3H)-pyrimidinone 5'-phosphate reductase